MKKKVLFIIFLSLFLTSCSSNAELHETILNIKNNYKGDNLNENAQYFNYDIDLNILDQTNNLFCVVSIRNKIYSPLNFMERNFYPTYYYQEINKYYFNIDETILSKENINTSYLNNIVKTKLTSYNYQTNENIISSDSFQEYASFKHYLNDGIFLYLSGGDADPYDNYFVYGSINSTLDGNKIYSIYQSFQYRDDDLSIIFNKDVYNLRNSFIEYEFDNNFYITKINETGNLSLQAFDNDNKESNYEISYTQSFSFSEPFEFVEVTL